MVPIVLETIFLKTQYLVLNDFSILNYIITGNVHIANKKIVNNYKVNYFI